MDDNVKSFLEKIQGISGEKIKVDVISSGKSIDISPMSFKQQKDLISTVTDGAVGTLKFQKVLNQIIIDNTGDNTLLSIDRLPIILKLRELSIGKNVEFGDDTVELQKIIENFPKKVKIKQSTKILGDIQISVEIPLLSYENAVIQATIDTLKKDGDDIGKSVGNMYTFEIVKYIKDVKFGEDIIIFDDISVYDRVKIVDNLPITTNQKIIEFIQTIKKLENDWLTVDVNGNAKTLDIDINFFDS